jgi:hypothetical protein
VAEHAAIPSQAEAAPPSTQPDTARPSLSSFFSSIASAFTTASTPKPDILNPNAVAQPEPPPRGDNGARKWRRHAEAKARRRHARAKRQRRYAEAKSQPPPEAKAKPGGISLDEADSDALFREYFGRK